MESTIPYHTLGRIGERVSAIGLGGWHLGLKYVDEQLSVRIIRTAIDRGINFLDNYWDYNDGASETRMGKALLDGYRQKVFLMTKIDGRSYAEATRQLDTSTTGPNCHTNRPGNKNGRCEGSSHPGRLNDSCRPTPTSTTRFGFAIGTRLPSLIAPPVARLLRPGKRFRVPIVLPERTHLPH